MPERSSLVGASRRQLERLPLGFDELLLRAALLKDERALAAWRELRPAFAAPETYDTALALIPTLRANLVALGVEDELLRRFESSKEATWAHNQALFAATLKHVAQIEAAGIPTMLLKGAALVAGGRHSVGFRYMADIDVLVPTSELDRAIDALLGLGFMPIEETPVWYVRFAAPRFNASYSFVDPAHWQMDLHWHLLPAACQPDADVDFWAAAVAVELRRTQTRVLCPADALLHAVLHGVLAPDRRAFRWVLDAALILAAAGDRLDYDRLVEQARKRRLTLALGVGLRYMRAIVDAPIPQPVMRALSSARPPRILERAELRAWRTPPSQFRRLDRIVFYNQQHARRVLPLGARAGFRRQLAAAREGFGIKGVRDVRWLPYGGVPGPGRPLARNSAAVDGRLSAADGAPVTTGEPLELGVPAPIPMLFRYGAWVNEDDGVWLAGTEAQIALALATPAAGSVVLTLCVVNFFAYLGRPARLEVAVSDRPVGSLTVHPTTPELEDARFHLPAAAIAGRSLLEVRLRMPDAVSPSSLGLNDNDRQIGLFLRRLMVAEPLACDLGASLEFGVDADGDRALVSGWSNAEPGGRWSDGPLAMLLLRVNEVGKAITLEIDADPYLGDPPRRMRVDLFAAGVRLGRFVHNPGDTWQPTALKATVPARCVGESGELALTLRIRDARSPHELGLFEDHRRLGVFIRRIRLAAARSSSSR